MVNGDLSRPECIDDEARAELLTYLVVAQLVGRARTGGWLRTDHLVESARIWLLNNDVDANWQERVRIGTLSETVALGFVYEPRFGDPDWLTQLFTHSWRLDNRSPVIRDLYAACRSALRGS
ncbi:hypothetical protein LFL96_36400 (plasmid) [Paraburkholderia sp. D15]|uniref:hypothetical protein n=1 Tax=Paraburkholderia sp. D15 TaxID=2880218 RepID=UPI00247A890C|nr:hypothetical protein [Paraburkholderia sp. D15]WGS54968.1 hypothetical protein LFL96_36400 [Paraburkholderia sp. D15]